LFYVQPCYYVSLHDKFYCLEVQVRVKGNEPSYHYKTQTTITKALKQVCEEFNWEFHNCRYGFLCHKHTGNFQRKHLKLLATDQPFPNKIPKYSSCNKLQGTCLSKAHTIWFEVNYICS